MPKNRSTKTDDKRNESRFNEKAQSIALGKMSRLPASLNGINKNLP
ncbi:hypothetical protein ACFPVX_02130 [Cohnella faecalis]|nr:hypothetical protein [Cohnella faecalis]